MKTVDKLDDIFKSLMQRSVLITNLKTGKKLKEGKIKLYHIKNNFLIIEFDQKSDRQEKIELPVPFDISVDNDRIVFDYRNSTLAKGDLNIISALIKIPPKNIEKNRFFNGEVLIEISE